MIFADYTISICQDGFYKSLGLDTPYETPRKKSFWNATGVPSKRPLDVVWRGTK